MKLMSKNGDAVTMSCGQSEQVPATNLLPEVTSVVVVSVVLSSRPVLFKSHAAQNNQKLPCTVKRKIMFLYSPPPGIWESEMKGYHNSAL